MTKRRAILQHQQQLSDITNIVNAMKNLAFLETRKLSQGLDQLQAMLESVETATADFLQFYPGYSTSSDSTAELWILFGSERGFCGDFNETLIQALRAQSPFAVIAVGSRLQSLLEPSLANISASPSIPMTTVVGASVAEEIVPTLTQLMTSVTAIEGAHPQAMFTLSALYHDNRSQDVRRQVLLPASIETPDKIAAYQQAPHTYLKPHTLYRELIHQRLFIALQQIATVSLMAENQRRIQHMDGAAQHLEKELGESSRRYQQLRQEEITEEIELISLNTFGDAWELNIDH